MNEAGDAAANAAGAARASSRRRTILAIGALVVAVSVMPLSFAADRLAHEGHVLRGVRVGGAELSGMSREEAEKAVRELAARLRAEPLKTRVRGQVFSVEPSDLGFRLDAQRTVDAAMSEGRRGGFAADFRSWLGRLSSPAAVEPVIAIDDAPLDAATATWEAKAIEDPPFEGAVAVKGAAVSPEYPRRGHGVDREGARRAVRAALGHEHREPVDLVLVLVNPHLRNEDIDAATAIAQSIVAGPVVLSAEALPLEEADREAEAGPSGQKAGRALEGDANAIKALKPSKKKKKGEASDEASAPPARVEARWSPEELARAIRSRVITEGEARRMEVYLDPIVIDEKLRALRPALERKPRDARFEVDDHDHVTIIPSRSGTRLDADKSAAAILAAASAPSREGALPVEVGEPPELSTEAAVELHIDHLVSEHTTRHPCCQPRVKNIHRIADLVDGRVVRPGETFSLNAAAGERTRANGFVLAPSIADGEMVDTMGGGVSQFATTFFNAMFYGGYDIIERQAHSFYFSRYPMGHEATLSWPKPDLVIRNDTAAGILIKTVYSKTQITVKLYGDNGGRKVRAKVSPLQDIVEPPVEHIPNPKLDPEKEKVKERGEIGWSVIVARVLTYPDGTKKEERRKVTYKPRVRRVQVHPCKIPKGEDGYTGEPCPKPEESEEAGRDEAEKSEPPPPPPPSDAAPF